MGRTKINDEFSQLNVSRQRKWQLRNQAKGLCEKCGDKAIEGMARCETCHRIYLQRHRSERGVTRCYANTKFVRATKPKAAKVKLLSRMKKGSDVHGD